MDKTSIAVTVFVFLILGYILFNIIDKDSANKSGLAIGIIVTLGILGLGILTQILHYELRDDCFVIKRPVKSVVIPFSEILKIENLNGKEIKIRRVFGNGGFLGYWGTFKSKPIDEFDFYANNKKNPILLVVKKEGNIIVSPDDTEMFEELKEKLNLLKNG